MENYTMNQKSNPIETLRELTKVLPQVPALVDMIHNPGNVRSYVEYEVEDGTSIGFGLLNQKEVAVQKLFLSKGTNFPSHKHDEEKEIGIVFQGKLSVTINGESRILGVGDVVQFDKNCCHSGKAIEDTWLIAVSIPRIEGYPN